MNLTIQNSLIEPDDYPSFMFLTKRSVVGITATALSILSAGRDHCINYNADKIRDITLIIPKACLHFFKKINPEASYDDPKVYFCKFVLDPVTNVWENNPYVGGLDRGFITWCVVDTLSAAAFRFSLKKSNNCSRLLYAACAITAVFTRTIDFALGVIFLAVASYQRGVYPTLNALAVHHLNLLSVVSDVFMSIRGVVNPQQF